MSALPDIVQNLIAGLSVGCIYAVIALGFTIIFSSTQLVNFAQGEFVMLGAMLSFWMLAEPPVGLAWPLVLALPAATMVTVVVGILLGWLLMRPLKNANQVSLIIITVGAAIFIHGWASFFWGKEAVAPNPFTDWVGFIKLPTALTGDPESLEVFVQGQELWLMGITLVMVLVLTIFFNKTMAGKALRAVAENREGARLVGINVSRMVIFAFALSAAIGALAGAALAPLSMAQYNMGTMLGLKGFSAAIVGGLGNFYGSVAAGLLLGVLENFGSFYLSSDYKDAFAFIILLLVLFVSPRGLPALFARRKAS